MTERRLLADVDVLVDVVGHVVEGLARVGGARRPVVAALLGVRLLRVVEVQVRRVRDHHLSITRKLRHLTTRHTHHTDATLRTSLVLHVPESFYAGILRVINLRRMAHTTTSDETKAIEE